MASRVEPELIRAVIREESRFRPSAGSGAAARGLMQFVISTAREVSIHLGFGEIRPDDLYRTDLSVRLGGRYLADLLAKFDSEKGPAIAAYNAGPSAAGAWRRFARNGEVERYLAAINYPETRAYVRKVYGSYLRYRQLAEEESGRASTERPATGPGGRHTSASD
jgi:soluble lytic murein transglycosylase